MFPFIANLLRTCGTNIFCIFFFFFLHETSHNFSLQCQMHANVAPNSLWCMSFPQGSAGVPGQPGEPGKEGKRVSKQKQSTSCVAWLVFVLTVRTWPGERPNSSWVVFVVLGEAKMICGQRVKGRCGPVVWQLMSRLHGQGVTRTHSQYDWQHKWLSPARWLWWTIFSFLRGQLDLG